MTLQAVPWRKVLKWPFLLAVTAGWTWLAIPFVDGLRGVLGHNSTLGLWSSLFSDLLQALVILTLVFFVPLYFGVRRRSFRAAFPPAWRYAFACMVVAYAGALFHSHYGARICYWPPNVISDEEIAAVVFKKLVGDTGAPLEFGETEKDWRQGRSSHNFKFISNGEEILIYHGFIRFWPPFDIEGGERSKSVWVIGIQSLSEFNDSRFLPEPPLRFHLVHPCGKYVGSSRRH